MTFHNVSYRTVANVCQLVTVRAQLSLYSVTDIHVEGGKVVMATRVVSSEISLGKFPEIYSNLSGNF